MNRRQFLGTAAASALAAQGQSPTQPPNIVFILADDLGYGDLGCYGQTKIATPNLDRLAAGGMRFTQAYAGSTVCAPSRCCLMTGRHTGHGTIRGNRSPEGGLGPNDVCVASLLKTRGYRTALFGKWGLGGHDVSSTPNDKGFDQFFGYLTQLHAHNSFPDQLWDNKREFQIPENWFDRKKTFSNDLFTQRALKFIAEARAEPFFLYLAYTVPHADNERGNYTKNGIDSPDQGKYAGQPWPDTEKNFAATITRMDDQIGQVLDALDAKGVRDNTLIIFTSDNGPHHEGNHDPNFFQSSGAVRGTKRDLYEGGIRVPTIANWKGRIQPGQVSDHAWAFWDFLPTAAELSGAKIPTGLDGISIVPALLGGKQRAHDYLYWEFFEGGFQQAVRQGDWKLVRQIPRQELELFDLKTDQKEMKNVAARHPDVLAKMSAIFTTGRTESATFPSR